MSTSEGLKKVQDEKLVSKLCPAFVRRCGGHTGKTVGILVHNGIPGTPYLIRATQERHEHRVAHGSGYTRYSGRGPMHHIPQMSNPRQKTFFCLTATSSSAI